MTTNIKGVYVTFLIQKNIYVRLNINELKYEMKWNIFFLIKFTTISRNTWKQNTRKHITYLIFKIKKKNKKKAKLCGNALDG